MSGLALIVQGVIRRGMQVTALRDFILSQGASKNVTVQEWDKIWTMNKKVSGLVRNSAAYDTEEEEAGEENLVHKPRPANKTDHLRQSWQ